MKISSLAKAIISLGGQYEITESHGREYLKGTVGKYEVEMHGSSSVSPDSNDIFTTRRIGTEDDHGSDYNPGGWSIGRRVKDLATYTA